MPLRESRCFVLRTYPVKEADRVVVLFSAEEGKVRGWARGARRPKSRLGSALGAGNEIIAGWFERQGKELVSVDRAELVSSVLPLVRDPVRGATVAFLAELLDIFAPERVPSPRLYRLMTSCRDALLAGARPEVAAAYFEAWVLRLSGLYPRPGRCGCGVGFAESGAHFFAGGPSWRCPDCPGGRPTASVEGAALRLLEEVWRLPPQRVAAESAPALELFRFHGVLTHGIAECRLPARDALDRLFAA